MEGKGTLDFSAEVIVFTGKNSKQVGPKADKVIKKKHCLFCEEFEGEGF